MLILEFPNISHREHYIDMIAEWKDFEPLWSPATLFVWESYEEFLKTILSYRENPESWRVPATLFFLVESESSRILWAIDIRHHIEHEYLRKYGGHIGYGIRPSERRKWYATKMLALWLEEARKLWIDRVMVSCHDDNAWSARVIESNGGILQDIIPDPDNKNLRRYWIDMNQ